VLAEDAAQKVPDAPKHDWPCRPALREGHGNQPNLSYVGHLDKARYGASVGCGIGQSGPHCQIGRLKRLRITPLMR
jgi:hypothetical protein